MSDMFEGFGMGSMDEVHALNKALGDADAFGSNGMDAGRGIVSADQQSVAATGLGAPLRVQSLDNSLKVITYTQKHINFWKDIPKDRAYSTTEEYNLLRDYGDINGGFLNEGELPGLTTSNYQRKTASVKFVGTTRSVTHVMTLVKTMIPDVIAQENSNGIMTLLRVIENSLFWGQSKGFAQSEYQEWDGLDQTVGNTYNLAGTSLSSNPFTTLVNDMAQTVVDNYGFPTDLYIPFPILAKMNDEFAGTAAQRIMMPTGPGNMQANINLDKLMTQAGPVNIKPTFFLQKTKMKTATELASATSGFQFTPGTAGTTVSQTATFTNGGTLGTDAVAPAAGAYTCYVTVSNRTGESAKLALTGGGSQSATLNGSTQTVGITLSATFVVGTVDFLNIYVSEAGSSADAFYLVQRVPLAAATTAYSWDGVRHPNTFTSFIGQMTSDILRFKQLSPLVKMDLATVAPAYKWMILMYGVPVMYVPQKWTRVINIKL